MQLKVRNQVGKTVSPWKGVNIEKKFGILAPTGGSKEKPLVPKLSGAENVESK